MGDESSSAVGYRRPSTGTIMELFDESVSCVKEMNSWKLDNVLSNAVAVLSTNDFLIEFVKPLTNYIHDECSRGSIRYAQEKMSKLCIRTCLNNMYLRLRSSKENCPRLVVASLLSEHESLDTIMHLIVAQNVGWDITYIGNGVQHDEITYAASNVRAQLVVLAINNQRDIARKIYEIKHIRDNAEKTEDIILIGSCSGWLGQSIYLREIHGLEMGAPPPLDLDEEKRNGDLVRNLIKQGTVSACHDISDGGILIAIAEMALASIKDAMFLGVKITNPTNIPDHAFFLVKSKAAIF